MTDQLRILTLNVWGLKFISPDRPTRLTGIIDHIHSVCSHPSDPAGSKSLLERGQEQADGQGYDVVCLQELWIYSDFERVREGLRGVLPESKFFRRLVRSLFEWWCLFCRVGKDVWLSGHETGEGCNMNLGVNVRRSFLYALLHSSPTIHLSHRLTPHLVLFLPSPNALLSNSGALGSGLAIFSRFPIISTHTLPYSLSGLPLQVIQGDFFVNKAAGSCVLLHPELGEVEVWSTHVSRARGVVLDGEGSGG
jgi:hypothetical protein